MKPTIVRSTHKPRRIGCAATLVSAEPRGLALDRFHAALVPESEGLIIWRIGDLGFDMHLSGQVPAALAEGLTAAAPMILDGVEAEAIALWAVNPGGRSVLDAVGGALALPPAALDISRGVLRDFGNMSSATILFVLERMMQAIAPGQRGCAMTFGPGLTAETMLFSAVRTMGLSSQVTKTEIAIIGGGLAGAAMFCCSNERLGCTTRAAANFSATRLWCRLPRSASMPRPSELFRSSGP